MVDRSAYADLDHPGGVKQPFLDRPAEGRAVVKARPEVVVARVAMGIDVDHAERRIAGDGAQDRE